MKGMTNSVSGPTCSTAHIRVFYPEGYVCSLTYGIITKTASDTSGSAKFSIPNNTEFIVACYKNGIERQHTNGISGSPLSTTFITLGKWLTFSSPNPFEMVSGDGSKIGWDGTIEYSTDGDNWNIWSGTTALSSGVSGDKNVLYVRGSNNTVITGENASSTAQGWHFSAPEISIDGNIATLLDWETLESGTLPTLNPWAFALLFAWSASAVNIETDYIAHSGGVILPWNTLSAHCYQSMFQANRSMVDIPKLPAINLAESCYDGMFAANNAISILPLLSAVNLPSQCYQVMFNGCRKLILSMTKTADCTFEYRIPNEETGVAGTDSLLNMFRHNGGDVPDTPSINTTYYTSNNIGGGTLANVYTGPGVPSAYQAVEYIESNGTQWIDTGITPTTDTKAILKFMNLAVTGNVIFGYRTDSDTTAWRLFNYNSNYYFDIPSTTSTRNRINGGSCPANELKEIQIANWYVKNLNENSNIISGNKVTFTGASTITLNRYGSSSCSSNRWYYVKIFENEILISRLIPCYRKTDGTAGVWDTVRKIFITNSGTGNFITGPEIWI